MCRRRGPCNVTADRYFAVIVFAAKHERDSRCAHRLLLLLIALACTVNAKAMRSPVVADTETSREALRDALPISRRKAPLLNATNPPHLSRLIRHIRLDSALSRKLTLSAMGTKRDELRSCFVDKNLHWYRSCIF